MTRRFDLRGHGSPRAASPKLLERFTQQFVGIFDRQYYTETGPLVQELEARLQQMIDVSNVVCISNPTVAWLMLLDGIFGGKIRVAAPPTLSRPALEALAWLNSEVTLCDLTPDAHYQFQASDLAQHTAGTFDCIVAPHLWGGAADIHGLQATARTAGAKLLFDSSASLGAHIRNGPIGRFGDAEVFALGPVGGPLGPLGAAICTNNDVTADKLRCMRSTSGVRKHVPVARTVNGRMSEAQAGLALIGLDDLEGARTEVRNAHEVYTRLASIVPGLSIHSSAGVSHPTYPQVILTIDPARARSNAREVYASIRRRRLALRRLSFPITSFGRYRRSNNLPQFDGLRGNGLEVPVPLPSEQSFAMDVCRALERLLT